MMSLTRRDPSNPFGTPEQIMEAQGRPDDHGRAPYNNHGGPPGPAGAGNRRKRRRQRPQRNKSPRPLSSRNPQLETASRERIFQELEGLLRQIREQAEESASWPEHELTEMTQTVTTFTKALEEQADPIPERARSEFQRIRERLSQALKNGAA